MNSFTDKFIRLNLFVAKKNVSIEFISILYALYICTRKMWIYENKETAYVKCSVMHEWYAYLHFHLPWFDLFYLIKSDWQRESAWMHPPKVAYDCRHRRLAVRKVQVHAGSLPQFCNPSCVTRSLPPFSLASHLLSFIATLFTFHEMPADSTSLSR